MKKTQVFLLFILISLVASYFVFDLGQYFSLGYFKSQRENFLGFYALHPWQSIGLFTAIYILVTALSLPGAALLTLLAGSLFGTLHGTIIVSFASTTGASLAMLLSRYLFRDMIENKWSDQLTTIQKGLEKEGAFYLFSLRLIPLFPFFLINLLFGLTRIKAQTFFWVSQVGMFLGTLVYVNAGTQLAQIESLSGIIEPKILLSFSALGLFPLLARKIVSTLKEKKVYRAYQKPKQFDYNLLVLGAGSGGLVSAYIAAAVKAKVALIEKSKMGGDCLNTGCVPSKAIIKSAKILSLSQRAKKYGVRSIACDFKFSEVMDRVHSVIKKIEPHDSAERYTELGVECISGNGKLISPWEVQVENQVYSSRHIIIATGARPLLPPIPGLDQIDYLTTDTFWNLREAPQRLLILGAGPIGCELAQAMQRLGSQVTLVEKASRILMREDEDIANFVEEQFKKEGIELLTGHEAIEFRKIEDQSIVIVKSNERQKEISFDQVLIALGRQARVKGFGLEELGVELTEKKAIAADEFLRTNFPNIFVVGDVTGPYQFTHTAAHQAWYASVNALFGKFKKFKVDYRVIPWATYTDPEIAQVGHNETSAQEQGIDYEVTRYGIDDLDRAIAESEDQGMIKVLTRPGTDKILGVTIVGQHAGDLIAEFILAMKYKLGLNKILGTIHIYPTWTESNKYVAGNWKKTHVSQRSLNYLKKFHDWMR